MKDPAVLFYTGDFLNGCTGLTFEERGQYITLLCLQHQTGHLSEKTIRLSVGSVSVDVFKKFKIDNEGLYFNERMDLEITKRSQYIDSRKVNGSKGGRPKKNKKPYAKPYAKAKQNHTEDENRNEIKYENINKDTWQKWINYKQEQFKFKYKSESSEQIALNELIQLSGNNDFKANEIINQSIAHGWKGLFELKLNGKAEIEQKPEPINPSFKPFKV